MHLPIAILNAYVEALPKLQARDFIDQSNVVAVGSGVLKPTDRAALVRGWSRSAGAQATRKPASREERMQLAASIGIEVT